MQKWGEGDSRARGESFSGDALTSRPVAPRDQCIAALIEGAPQFPMDEIAEDLILKMQGGLRGLVRRRDLN